MPDQGRIRPARGMARDAVGYLAAFAVGIAAVAQAFPGAMLAGRLPPGAPKSQDYLQHLIAQMYFLAQPWSWPPLQLQKLNPPHGVNLALTDGIPLAVVAIKLLHGIWPGVRQGLGPWLAVAWVLQPVAAVYALRGTGERRWPPALAAAVLAAAMPTFLFRFIHEALDGHFLLLVALGLYLRATRTGAGDAPVRAMALLAALIVTALFVHPYLMAMVAAVAAAVPLTLLIRTVPDAASRRPAAVAAAILGAGLVAALLAVRGFGYAGPGAGAGEADGYGLYSMNLVAPVWPVESSLLPGAGMAALDATGGQYEGYQYLGLGVIGLLAAVLVRGEGRRWLRRAAGRHAGLALAMAGLTAYALSTHVFLGRYSFVDFGFAAPGGGAFRAAGRFFWPVAYALVLVGVRGTCLAWPARPLGGWRTLLVAASVVQVLDSWGLRQQVRIAEFGAQGQKLDATLARLDSVMGHYRAVSLRPRFECGVTDKGLALQALALAARHDLVADTMYAARVEPANACRLADAESRPGVLAPGVLGIASGQARGGRAGLWLGSGSRCGVLGEFTLCSADGAGLDGLPPAAVPALPQGRPIGPKDGTLFRDVLGAGWHGPEDWGVWSGTAHPTLALTVAAGDAPVRVTLGLHAPPGETGRDVTVHAGDLSGPVLARWPVRPRAAPFSVVLPAAAVAGLPGHQLTLVLDNGPTVGVPVDERRFGVGLEWFRIDPAVTP